MPPRSVKIVRNGFRFREKKRMKLMHFHGNHVLLILQNALNQQKLLMYDDNVMFPKNLWRQNRV